jgi:hypothetical protein
MELFELYAILLPFDRFVRAVEMRSCSLRIIAVLTRQLLQALADVATLLRTSIAMAIFRDVRIGLLTHLTVNNLLEALAAYSLTPHGRPEIRALEIGYRTRDLTNDIHLPPLENQLSLKICRRGESSYGETMRARCHMIINTTAVIVPDEPAADGSPLM